ncbi:MAG: alpha/beta hydrolase [Desulfosalsimonadaceae bacterium]
MTLFFTPSRFIRWLMLLSFLLLTACAGVRHNLYDSAMAHERGKAGLTLKTLAVNGKSISLLESERDPAKPTIVLIHGFAANKENWVRFSRYLTGAFHVVAMDLPGHGESVKDLNLNYDLDDQVGYVHEVLTALHIDTFHLAGNSMGGAISCLYAAAYPRQVQSLFLIDPSGIYQHKSELMQCLEKGDNPLIVTSPKDFNRLMDFALERKPFIPWPVTGVMAEKAVANRPVNEDIFSQLRGPHKYVFADELKKITVPTLILWGTKDRIIHVDNASVFQQLIPHSRKMLMEDIGHAPMIEAPEQTAEIFMDFILSLG